MAGISGGQKKLCWHVRRCVVSLVYPALLALWPPMNPHAWVSVSVQGVWLTNQYTVLGELLMWTFDPPTQNTAIQWEVIRKHASKGGTQQLYLQLTGVMYFVSMKLPDPLLPSRTSKSVSIVYKSRLPAVYLSATQPVYCYLTVSCKYKSS